MIGVIICFICHAVLCVFAWQNINRWSWGYLIPFIGPIYLYFNEEIKQIYNANWPKKESEENKSK